MRLFLVGLLALLCQIVLLRELNVAFYGIELVYALALVAWMVGGAAGAAFAPPRLAATPGRLRGLLAIAALSLPADVVLIRVSRAALGGVPGAYLPFEQQILVLAASMLPTSMALGVAFRWAADLAASEGRSLGWAYGIESAGAAVGAASATLAFVAGMQTFTVAVVTAGAVVAAQPARAARRVAALALTVATALAAPSLDLRMTAWSHPSVVESRDSAYGRITAASAGGQTAVFVDDVAVYESEAARHEELAHVAALQHPAPLRILLLGGSAERIDRDLRQHRPDRIDVVEIDRVFVEVAGRGPDLASTITIDDPRAFLHRAGEYDLIVVATPEPTSGQSNRFYTQEFFAECLGRLADGGVLAFRLEMPENVLTPLASLRAASVLSAVASVFPFVHVLRGASAIVSASRGPLPDGADTLIERWQSRGLSARLVTPAYLRYLFDNDRGPALRRLLGAGAVPNSDARPVAYRFAALTWLSKIFPELIGTGTDRGNAAFAPGASVRRITPRHILLAAIVVVVFALARWRRRVRTALLAGVAGFSGMVLETVLLLAYQARSGALYERLGVLLTAFMVGLAFGAWSVGRLLTGTGPLRSVRSATVALLATSAIFGALTAALLVTGATMGLALAGAMLFGVGASVAGVFACAAAAAEAGTAPGSLYGADLAGGALGSLAAGLILIPIAGLVPTTWLVVGLSALALLLA